MITFDTRDFELLEPLSLQLRSVSQPRQHQPWVDRRQRTQHTTPVAPPLHQQQTASQPKKIPGASSSASRREAREATLLGTPQQQAAAAAAAAAAGSAGSARYARSSHPVPLPRSQGTRRGGSPSSSASSSSPSTSPSSRSRFTRAATAAAASVGGGGGGGSSLPQGASGLGDDLDESSSTSSAGSIATPRPLQLPPSSHGGGQDGAPLPRCGSGGHDMLGGSGSGGGGGTQARRVHGTMWKCRMLPQSGGASRGGSGGVSGSAATKTYGGGASLGSSPPRYLPAAAGAPTSRLTPRGDRDGRYSSRAAAAQQGGSADAGGASLYAVRRLDLSGYVADLGEGGSSQRGTRVLSPAAILHTASKKIAQVFASYAGAAGVLCQPIGYATDTASAEIWLVYPYLPHENLLAWWRRRDPEERSESELAVVVKRLLAALASVHGEGVVHGSLRTANVLVNPANDSFVLVNHGLHHLEKYLQGGPAAVGLPPSAAAAPTARLLWSVPDDVAHQTAAPHQRDLWCLGLVVCELIKGRHLLEGRSARAIDALLRSPDAGGALDEDVERVGDNQLVSATVGAGARLSLSLLHLLRALLARAASARPASCNDLLARDPFIKKAAWRRAAAGRGGSTTPRATAGQSPASAAAAAEAHPARERGGGGSGGGGVPTADFVGPTPGLSVTSSERGDGPKNIPTLSLSGLKRRETTSASLFSATSSSCSPRFATGYLKSDPTGRVPAYDGASERGVSAPDMSPREGLTGGAGVRKRHGGGTAATPAFGSFSQRRDGTCEPYAHGVLQGVLSPSVDAVLNDVPAGTARQLFGIVNEFHTISEAIEQTWPDASALFVKEILHCIESSPVSAVRTLASPSAAAGHQYDAASNASSASCATASAADLVSDTPLYAPLGCWQSTPRGGATADTAADQLPAYSEACGDEGQATPREAEAGSSVALMRRVLVQQFLRKQVPEVSE